MNIENEILARWKSRQEKYKTILRHSLPEARVLNEPYFRGTYSVTLTQTRTRFVLPRHLCVLQEVSETPTAAARDYLVVKYKKPRRVNPKFAREIETDFARTAFPLYAKPRELMRGFYVDITKAFFSILQMVGWNVAYCPQRYLSAGTPPTDFPFVENAVARDMLVSAAASKFISLWMPTRPSEHARFFSRLYNPQINLLVRDVLHACAQDAVRAGAIYVAMDGYIAPDEKSALAIIDACAQWGLHARVKAEGAGRVNGIHSYTVGEKYTLRQTSAHAERSFLKEIPYARWLKARVTAFAKG